MSQIRQDDRQLLPRAVRTTIQFQEDHFVWDAGRRRFFLDEPETLLGDRLARTDVQAHRVHEGWSLLFTTEIGEDDTRGLIDLWSKTSLEDTEVH